MGQVHLGIHYGHNATIAVVSQGKLIFCQSEERLNRIKNSTGFPSSTLNYIYKNVCSPEDVASATLFQESIQGYLFLKKHGFKSFQYGGYLSPEVVSGKGHFLESMKWDLGQWRAKQIKEKSAELRLASHQYYSKALNLPVSRIYFQDHHRSHAYSAVPNIQSWGKALVFTLDGVGDYTSATVSRLNGKALELIQSTDHRNSLGYFYSATTAILGMKSGEHEFKVMGLAPYSSPYYYKPLVSGLREMLWIDSNGQFVAKHPPSTLMSELDKLFRFQRFDNIAGAIQEFTEEIVLSWIHWWIDSTGIRNIAVSGGVFMNVKACQKVLASSAIEKMFVVPSAADESTAIGAAFASSVRLQPEIELAQIDDLYLGLSYTDDQTEQCLKDKNVEERYTVSRPENINHEVALLLSKNEVVARFAGRMEFGARALGNRSILANPSSFQNIELINSAIKNRDFWMPFTPSILEEDMSRYIVNSGKMAAPYMCITFDTTEEARKDIPAAIHPRDKTARPQCVIESWNSGYHELISEFKRLTGIGAVLNTSFNLHGEPNVCSPEDAIHTIDSSGLKYLAIGPFLLTKNAQVYG